MEAVERWLPEQEAHQVYTAGYWNDLDTERRKELWIDADDHESCRRYLESSKLLLEYQEAEPYVRQMSGQQLQVVDLAAGIGWTSALLSKLGNVAEVHAVDISWHRLELQFPHCVTMLGGRAEKIRRYLGSFYDLKLADHSMDVAFLSHAFHHADDPRKLLTECDRVLKANGRIVVVGEHEIGALMIVRRFLAVLLRQRMLVTGFHRLFPPDPVLGDHYYRRTEYKQLFASAGYRLRHHLAASGNAIYVADKGEARRQWGGA
jgi:ubiquinone/menaquinone biosynthesis C-methylase UbiE